MNGLLPVDEYVPIVSRMPQSRFPGVYGRVEGPVNINCVGRIQEEPHHFWFQCPKISKKEMSEILYWHHRRG